MARESILVVDDDAAVLRIMTQMLERAGYGVLAAPGAGEALQVFPQHQDEIALAICDVMMPVMSGPLLAERLMALRPGLPVLLITGYRDRAGDGQGLPILYKPFTMSALLKKTRELLGGQSFPGRAVAGGTMAG